jgi:3-oxoacyl-[acyl-carrier protein] reductase
MNGNINMADLKGKVALVTGASRRIGIGAAICRALAARGADIFFTEWQAYDQTMPWGTDSDGPEALNADIEALGVRCAHLAADLSLPETPEQILDAAETQLGPVSILVNNATYSVNAGYETLTAELLDAHYAVNMRGTFLLTTSFVKRFRGISGGRIISLTSGQSVGAMPGELPYIATKGAVEAFSTSLAAAVAKLGITVNAVDPGATDTGWMTDDFKERLLNLSPRGRIGQPEDAARLIAFLASDEAEWITGQVIHSRGSM